MQISRSELSLTLLNSEDAELLRSWRNDDRIRSSMIYQEKISATEQEAWFQRINNEQNYFFLIRVNTIAIGMIHLSDIDFSKQTAFSGMFIYEEKYIGSAIPVMASTLLLDFFFPIFKLQQIYAKVLLSNHRAIKYNDALGFKTVLGQSKNKLLAITPQSYEAHAAKLKAALQQLGQLKIEMQINQAFLAVRPILRSALEPYQKENHQEELISVVIS